MRSLTHVSTGLSGLDEIIDWLRIGDNVVWQVDDISDYKGIVRPFVEGALESNHKVVYMRFAHHEPLFSPRENLTIYTLNSSLGFETFSTQVHTIITEEGQGVFYVFDSLSDLLSSWATDLMIGNFFLITCPYLFELNTIAYFAIVRNRHSYATVARIRETTQVLLDTYNCDGQFYVQPLKVWKRYSPTMFLPHMEKGQQFIPITSSVDAAKLFTHMSRFAGSSKRILDYWDRLFIKAEDMLSRDTDPMAKANMVEQLCEIMVTRDPRMASLVKEHLVLEDMLDIKARLIGSGFIGGKTVGLLLSRKILSKDLEIDWGRHLEPHDSFYVGSDVFYSYLVNNGCWKLRMEQKTEKGYFNIAPDLADRMLYGTFPDEIKEHFLQVIEYFGQSPIIVRSSSLLEDSFGNAFAGKYESIFCANQGSPEQRYEKFEEAVKRIFASTMNEDALIYRRQRGLEFQDEQMALLVQRVSGSYRKHYFFPDIGGVGVSHNTFVWKTGMDSSAGMIRMVFGLGTRAVDRVEGDYPRVVALDDPLSRPFAGMDELRTFSQHNVDVINTIENVLETKSVMDLVSERLGIPMERIALFDDETTERIRERGKRNQEAWIITFDDLLTNSLFVDIMHRMLKLLEKQYAYPVDIEFTVNFTDQNGFRINLVQCRPLQTIGEEKPVMFPERVPDDSVFFSMEGNFMGGSILQDIERLIYVEPDAYMALPLQEKYEVARIIGRLNRQITDREHEPTMIMGPGRWGTTTPSLGIPVHFSEINNIAVMVEVASIEGNFMPELSYGTHFFQDLVENKIFFVAIFPWKKGVTLQTQKISGFRNELEKVLPESSQYADVIHVLDIGGKGLRVIADVVSQKIMSFFDEDKKEQEI
ncbi:MAG: PEP/pyruvate-binding domain-containing protein [Desulfomonilia bacterium]